MNPMLKVSAAVLIAAMSALPALAAVNATVIMGMKSDIAPVATLDTMVGKWGQPQIDSLNKASTVTVFDANKLYTPADIKLLGAADTAASVNLTKLRSAIDADATLKAWFDKNKIDVSHVIAITDANGKVDVYTF